MRITDVTTWAVANPPPSYGGKYWVFLQLATADGITGVGEVYAATFSPDVVCSMIEEVAGRHLIGCDPHHIERFWRTAYGRGYSARPEISLLGVMSGLEMACWDIIGKAAGKPVYELLGGQIHERLRTYTYLYPEDRDGDDRIFADPDLAAERALEYVDAGFTAVKFDPTGGYSAFDPRQPSMQTLDRSEIYVSRIREAVGSRADLLFGTHGQFTASGALRLAQRLEPYEPLWLEEPVPAEMPEEMARVAAGTTIPIATGERLATKYEFARVLQSGAARILQMNLGRVGGLLEAKKIAGMAEAHYAQIAPHLYCGPVVGAANIQIAACSPNFLILEGILDWSGFSADVLAAPIRWEAGCVIPSAEPGLGIELDEAVLEAHAWGGEGLHLEMHEEPLG